MRYILMILSMMRFQGDNILSIILIVNKEYLFTMYSPHLHIFLLFLSLIRSSTSSPLQTLYIQSSQCTFFYTLTPSFTFHHCSFQKQRPPLQYAIWNDCLITCCPQMPEGDFTANVAYETIEICRKYNLKEGEANVIVVVMIVLVTGFAVLVMTFFGGVLWKIWKSYKKGNRVGDMHVQIKETQWKEEPYVNNDVKDIKWSPLSQENSTEVQRKSQLKNASETCSICLDQQPNCQLFCKHEYHPNCIGSWFKKSDNCPCCRREDIKGLKVYCQECRSAYFIATRFLMVCFAAQIPKLCPKCSKKQQFEVSNIKGSLKDLLESDNSKQLVFDAEGSHQNLVNRNELIFEDVQ